MSENTLSTENLPVSEPVAEVVAATPPVEVDQQRVIKSRLIEKAFKEQGLEASANEIIESIKTTADVEVTVGLINNVRFRLRNEKATRQAKREAAKIAVAKTEEDPFADLFAVKRFADKVGGVTKLKFLVTKLEQLLLITKDAA